MVPLVTVGIPTIRRLAFLKEAVLSVQRQSYAYVDILVSDDGRNPELESWVRSVADKDSRVRYQQTAGAVGLAGNWNAILRSAKGTYTTIIGDDDRLLPRFIEHLLTVDGSADVIFCNHYLIDNVGRRLQQATSEATRHYGRDRLPNGRLTDPLTAVWDNSIPMSASLIRTSVLRTLGFKESLNTPELDFFVRLASHNGSFAFSTEYLSEYRVHSDSETARGLTLAALAERLSWIPVPARLQHSKDLRIASLMVGAVSVHLAHGDLDAASRLVRSPLYPRPFYRSPRIAGQLICSSLPPKLGVRIYQTGRAVLRAVKRWSPIG
jgi:glycosyltransferase involved in cell wall biosynthesis